jgi:hypothetical protein
MPKATMVNNAPAAFGLENPKVALIAVARSIMVSGMVNVLPLLE